ncbi:MAG: hypothetical protein AB1705_14560 [Verrucomicrobiota bacterium]
MLPSQILERGIDDFTLDSRILTVGIEAEEKANKEALEKAKRQARTR